MIKKVIQQGRSDFDARSVLPVREHDKMATCLREALRRRQGTLLVAIFNIPLQARKRILHIKQVRMVGIETNE
jgi:hypothetical protein